MHLDIALIIRFTSCLYLGLYKYKGEKYVHVKFKENYHHIIHVLSLCEIPKIFRNLDTIKSFYLEGIFGEGQ